MTKLKLIYRCSRCGCIYFHESFVQKSGVLESPSPHVVGNGWEHHPCGDPSNELPAAWVLHTVLQDSNVEVVRY